MAIRYSQGVAHAMLDGGLRARMQGGTLQLRSGSAPSNASDAATGTLLCSVPVGAFNVPSGGEMTVSGPWTGIAVEDGTVGWARMVAGAAVIDFTSVTGPGAGGDIEISNNISEIDDTQLYADGSVNIVAGSLSVPGTS